MDRIKSNMASQIMIEQELNNLNQGMSGFINRKQALQGGTKITRVAKEKDMRWSDHSMVMD